VSFGLIPFGFFYFIGLYLELFSVRRTFENDLVTGVSDPIEDCIGNDGIGEEPGPISEGPVGSKNDALGAEAAVNDGVEAFCRDLIDCFEAEVIDDEKINGKKTLHGKGEFVLKVSESECGEETTEGVVRDGEHHATRRVSNGFGEMCFARPCRADEEDTLSSLHEAAAGESTDEFGIDIGIELPVERFQGRVGA